MKNNSDFFVYWLNGFVELCGEKPTETQWEIIKEHLALVFKKETGVNLDTQLFKKLPIDTKYC